MSAARRCVSWSLFCAARVRSSSVPRTTATRTTKIVLMATAAARCLRAKRRMASKTPGGFDEIGSSARKLRRSSARSDAVRYRRVRSFSRALRAIVSRSPRSVRSKLLGRVGSSDLIRFMATGIGVPDRS